VLIRRHASSVNPVDDGIAAGMVKDTFRTSSRSPSAMSSRAVVEPIGDGVAGALTGDEGYGLVRCDGPDRHVGRWAEPIVVPEVGLADKPDGVDLATAVSAFGTSCRWLVEAATAPT
jgi:NADPH:quinone reductase-like Zn-dependent oxidoreductase